VEIIIFYLVAAIAIFSTVRVITNTNPVHALLNLVVSLLAVAMIFFMLGAPFAGALEIIVYAGFNGGFAIGFIGIIKAN
jgi:NADH-quinone oxidoreductase subunit J